MTTTTVIAELRDSDSAAAETAPELPHWLAAHRSGAAEIFGRLPFPQRRDEAWRYTPVERLITQPFAGPERTATPEYVEPVWLSEDRTHRLVFMNGCFVPGASSVGDLPTGVTVAALGEAIEQSRRVAPWLGRIPVERLNSFSALNGARLEDGLFVHVPANTRLDTPIEVLYLGRDGVAAHPRGLVVLETGAEATVIERCIGDDSPYLHNAVTEVHLDPGAALTHHRLQQDGSAAYHLLALFLNQQAGSRYTGSLYSLGGGWSRTEFDIGLNGEGATCDLGGLYTVAGQQLNDVHVNLEHRVPGCRAEVEFKGVLHGKGRGVFDGRILVEPGAQQTEAHLNNANLVLDRGAEIDTKPQLEIFADDVKCSHGTTVGQLDPNQVFYLRSRGIAEGPARRMLALGFAAEVLERCKVDALRAAVEDDVAGKLDQPADAK